MNHRRTAPSTVLLALSLAASAAATEVVVPNVYASAEGVVNNSYPYRYTSGGGRYQQSFDAAQFTGPILIDEIGYRYHMDNPAGASTADFRMTLSYCATSWNTLSGTFASNVGAGAAVVFDGVWTVTPFGGDPATPNPFTQRLKLTTPFQYDPALGDLLMDVQVRTSTYPTGGLAGAFAASGANLGVNRVYKDDGNPNSTSGFVSAVGLITEFVAGGVDPYGAGCPGTGQIVPTLAWTGAPAIGGQISLGLASGLGGAPSVTLIGFLEASAPVGGTCSLLVAPPFLQLFIPLGGSGPGAGSYTLPGVIPPTSPPGTIRLQAFVADPGTPVGLSATNGLAVTIQ